jgi:hypothetical protein
VVVDGTLGYSTAAIKIALCNMGCGSSDCSTCATNNGGVVRLGQNCNTKPCTTGQQVIQLGQNDKIYIPSNTVLDLGGNILEFESSGTSCPPSINGFAPMIQMLSPTGGPVPSITGVLAVANSTEGSSSITIAANSFVSTGLAAGQLCQLNNMYVDGAPSVNYNSGADGTGAQMIKVLTFTNSSGVITFRPPLIGAWGNPANPTYVGTISCYTAASIVSNAGLINGGIMAGGNCQATQSALVYAQGFTNLLISDIQMSGTWGGAVPSGYGIVLLNGLDSTVRRISAVGLSGSAGFGITPKTVGNSLFQEIRFESSVLTYGMYMRNLHHSTIDGLTSVDSSAALAAMPATYCIFRDVVITHTPTSASTGAVQTMSRARSNVFDGLTVSGGSECPIDLGSSGDSYNQFRGLSLHNNNNQGPCIAAGSIGNYFDGDIDASPASNGNAATSGPIDYYALNAFRAPLNADGFSRTIVHNTTMASTDFVQNRMLGFSFSGSGVGSNIVLQMIGADGVVRKILQAMS